MEQTQGNNIEKEVDTTTMIIYWKMRNWKTLNAICIGLQYYPRIYSNVNMYQNWKSIVKFLEDYQSIKNIRFSYTPWILIIDEAWLNVNSKDSFSKDNRLMQEVLFLIGKKNLSLIWIAQRFESIDVNARALVDLILKMTKIRRQNQHPTFIVTKQRQKWWQLEFITQYKMDSISILKSLGVTYNQLEESKLSSTKNLETAKSTKNLVWIKKSSIKK